jgi:hypothetical protein
MEPVSFVWCIDQHGYKIERLPRPRGLLALETPNEPYEWEDILTPAGGPPRYYNLQDDSLWLKFAKMCSTRDGVLSFVSQHGGISQESFPFPSREPLKDFIVTADRLNRIAERLDLGERESAAEVFWETSQAVSTSREIVGSSLGFPIFQSMPRLLRAPLMQVVLVPSKKRMGNFEWYFVPSSLRDALLFQAAEAIAGNRRFQRCRYEGCSNWFRLGPHTAAEGRRTITARRKFCSDRCRVAADRRKKKAIANA